MTQEGRGIFRKFKFEIGVEDTIPGHPKSDNDYYNPKIWIRTRVNHAEWVGAIN